MMERLWRTEFKQQSTELSSDAGQELRGGATTISSRLHALDESEDVPAEDMVVVAALDDYLEKALHEMENNHEQVEPGMVAIVKEVKVETSLETS